MRPAVVNRATHRPLIALLVAAAAVVGWLGAPLLAPLGDPVAATRPSQSAGPTGSAGSPAGSASPGTSSPAGAPSPVPVGSPGASAGPGPGHGTGGLGDQPVPLYRARATPQLRAALDARLEALRAKAGIPGISASIVFPDGGVWQGSAGLRDVAVRSPVTTETVFPAASISKTFTSALILALVEDGRLALDAPVVTYLPALKIDRTITIRQLLDHRSGLRDFYFHPAIDKALLAHPSALWTALRSLSYVGKPYAKPGTSWHYSNTNYLILGLVAEAVGGAPVATQLRTRFLTPLGLDHTFYQAVEPPRGPLAHGYVFSGVSPNLRPIDLSDGTTVVPFTSVVTAAGAAGSIATTAGDLAQWARALYDGSALTRDSRAEMVADALLTAPYKPSVAYGLGVQVVSIDGHPTLGHSGRFLGARAAMRWVVDERVAIAVMTDQSRSDPSPIVADLLKLALQPQLDCNVCPVIP